MSDSELVQLRDVLQPARREASPEPGKSYRLLGVQLWGRGVYEREAIDGANTRYKKFSQVRAGDVVVNKIWARNGSVGVVPPELDGCYVTTEFPVFVPVDALDPRWFHWLCRTRWFWQECDLKSRGTSGKNRIRPEAFLDIAVPFPGQATRARVLRTIEACQETQTAARKRRERADIYMSSLFSALLARCWSESRDWTRVPIGELVTPVTGLIDPQDPQYRALPHINGEAMESGTGRLLAYRTAAEDEVKSGKYLFDAGAVLYSKIRPYLRKATQVPVRGVCSADVYAFEEFPDTLDRRFFMYSLIEPNFTAYAVRLSGRTRMPKLNQKQLAAYSFPLPPLKRQREIVRLLDAAQGRIEEVQMRQLKVNNLLEALERSVLASALGVRPQDHSRLATV